MRDVAVLAGVGVMTVSPVVNGRGGVGPERAARMRQAIEKLDYRHNVMARHLRLTGQSAATIGVLLEDVANPFLAEQATHDLLASRPAPTAIFTAQLAAGPGHGHALAGALLDGCCGAAGRAGRGY